MAGLAMQVYSDRIGVDPDDQSRLRFSVDDILSLPAHHAINLWLADGRPQPGFLARTSPWEDLRDDALVTHHLAAQRARRRVTRLFRAGLVERFRPYLNRGSYKWTYTLTRGGFRVARDGGALPGSARFTRRSVYDYRFVLHDLQLNAWAIAYRRLAGSALLAWHGEDESLIDPPSEPGGRDL